MSHLNFQARLFFLKMITLSLALSFISCSSFDTSNIAPGLRGATSSISKAIFGYSDDYINKNLVDSIPYASMKVRIGKGPSGLMILESIEGGKSVWVSNDNVYLVIKEGKIIRTSGLVNNLTIYESPPVTFNEIIKDKFSSEFYYAYYSYDYPELYGLKTKVVTKNLGKEIISILGEEKEVFLLEEKVVSKEIGWKVKNSYWIDSSSGFVWKSRQYISPKLPVLEIEVTKKPAI